MNILELAMYNADFLGSFGESILALGKELKQRDIRMIVVLPKLKDWCQLFKEEGFIVEIIPMGYPIDIKGTIKLLNLVAKYQVEIIHTHFGLEYSLAAAIVHLISPLHPHLVWHWRGGPARPNLVKKVVGTSMYKFLDALVRVHIPNSDLIKEQLIQYKIVTPSKVIVIYNGINPDRFKPREVLSLRNELGIGFNELIIGNIRNFRSRVHHKLVIDTAKLVISKNKNVRFILVGDGPTRKEMEKYADTIGIRRKIIFTGIVQEVEKVYASCNLTIVSYEPWCGESICNAVYESLCMEKIVVMPNIGSTPYVFKENDGVFIAPPNPEAMAEKVIELLNKDLHTLNEYGKNGRQKVLEQFTTEKWAKRIANIYAKTLLNKSSP